jgi:hypothetical protein
VKFSHELCVKRLTEFPCCRPRFRDGMKAIMTALSCFHTSAVARTWKSPSERKVCMICNAKLRLQVLEFRWNAYSASAAILTSFYNSLYKHSVQRYRLVMIIVISHSIQCDILRHLHPFSLSIIRRYRLAITTSSHSVQWDMFRNSSLS